MLRPQFLYNGQIRQTDELVLRAGQVGLFTGWGVFSTIKIAGGVLFEFRRHWARMRKDADLLRVPFTWSPTEMEELLMTLVSANQEHDATLRVYVSRNGGTAWAGPGSGRDSDLVAFTAPRSHWGASARLGIVPNARHAENPFAGLKTTSWAMNLVCYEEAHRRGQDEVVLLNERYEVCECTSANIFAVSGDEVLTPPLSSGCLPGITRELLLEVVRAPGVDVSEKVLTLDDLESADSVFITSTTRDLLPVSAVEGLSIRCEGDIHGRLAAAFSAYEAGFVNETSVRERTRTF